MYKRVFSAVPVPAIIVRMSGFDDEVVNVNDSILKLLDCSSRQLIGKGLNVIIPDSPKGNNRSLLETAMVRALETGDVQILPERVIHSPGNRESMNHGFDLTLTPLDDLKEQNGHILLTFQETERTQPQDPSTESISGADKYKALFDNSMAALFITKPDGTILEANRAACAMFGYTEKEFRQLGRQGVIDSESPALKKKLKERAETGQASGTLTGIRKDKKKIICEFSSRIFTDASGEQFSTVLLIDITDKKATECELRKQKEFIETALDNLPIGVAINQTSDGKVTHMNKRFSEIYGWSRKQLTDVESFFMCVYPDPEYREQLKRKIEADIASGDPSRMIWKELEITTKSGDKRIVDGKNIPLLEQGLMISTVMDVTAEKQSESDRTRILESISDAFYAVDDSWRFTYFNKRAEKLLGKTSDEVIGKNIWSLIPNLKGTLLEDRYRSAVAEEQSKSFEFFYPETDTWFSISAYPNNGGLSVFFRDVTEQKTKDEELISSLREKDILLAEIHHRVKNNLAIVSSLLQMQAMNSKDLVLSSQLIDGVLRIKSMATIHEQLYQSDSFYKLPFSDGIRKLVQDIVDTLQSHTQFDLQFDMDHVELNINQGVPCSLLVNEVVANILKHNFEGRETGKISTRLREKEHTVTLEIEDNGNGLPEDFRKDDDRTLGLQLINLLTSQLRGSHKYTPADPGTIFSLTFEKSDSRGSGNSLDL